MSMQLLPVLLLLKDKNYFFLTQTDIYKWVVHVVDVDVILRSGHGNTPSAKSVDIGLQ